MQHDIAQDTSAHTSSSAGSPRTARTSRWRVVDIVVASVIGVASGVVFWAWGLATTVLGLGLEFLPGLGGLLGGGWLFAGVLGGLIIRKPGAALYTELIAAAVSALVGTQWGYTVLISGLVQGLGAELVFALSRYRSSRLVVAVLAGMGAAVGLVVNDLLGYYAATDGLFKSVYAVSSVVSGALLAGLVSFLLVRALAASGALDRFASGRRSRRVEGSTAVSR